MSKTGINLQEEDQRNWKSKAAPQGTQKTAIRRVLGSQDSLEVRVRMSMVRVWVRQMCSYIRQQPIYIYNIERYTYIYIYICAFIIKYG